MLIVIPTFRRNECLRWVLQSLVQCSTTDISEVVRVVVVANYPSALAEVKAIVRPFFNYTNFHWRLLEREETLDPIDNWYSAIRDHAMEGETVLLHGDDDLFFPWSLKLRWKLMNEASADFLLTPFVSRVFFDQGGQTAFFSGELPAEPQDLSWKRWDYAADKAPDPVFIGTHTYRYGPRLEAAIRATLDACHTQTWVDRRNQELMLPFYLPFFLKQSGGSVIMSDLPCVLRGASVREICASPFGVPSWNSCFVDMLALALIRSGSLGREPKLLRYAERRFYGVRAFAPTMLADKRIAFRTVRKTLRVTGLSLGVFFRPTALRGWALVAANALGVVGLRLRRQAARASVPTPAFLQRILGLVADHKPRSCSMSPHT